MHSLDARTLNPNPASNFDPASLFSATSACRWYEQRGTNTQSAEQKPETGAYVSTSANILVDAWRQAYLTIVKQAPPNLRHNRQVPIDTTRTTTHWSYPTKATSRPHARSTITRSRILLQIAIDAQLTTMLATRTQFAEVKVAENKRVNASHLAGEPEGRAGRFSTRDVVTTKLRR